jgi:hypothetical protein
MEGLSSPLPEIGYFVIAAPLGAIKTLFWTTHPWWARTKRIQGVQEIILVKVKLLIAEQGIQTTGIGCYCEIQIIYIHEYPLILYLGGIKASQDLFVGEVLVKDVTLAA